jgi:HD superfamily phosphohydrolase
MRAPLYTGLPKHLALESADLQDAFGSDLTRYAEIAKRSRTKASKVINDAIWRTVRLEAWEVVIVDSPLFQRLRRIRQLGLAGYVYPGAGYSRFEHSIGVLHQTQRVIDAVNRNAKAFSVRKGLPIDVPVPRFEETRLRLTALLHDIGHGLMSHVSERAVLKVLRIGDQNLSMLRREAATFFSCIKPPSLGEVLSGLLILLPEFREVLSAANIPDWTDTDALAYEMARTIVGGRDAKTPFLTEILSGSMDADKLDYLPRDCYMAGLPMPVDVDRLLEKISVVPVPASTFPDDDRELFQLRDDEFVRVLAVQSTGTRAFEELVVSRALLFQKLYHHQKVRAMEGMVRNAIELLAREPGPFQKLSTYLKLADDEFLLGNWPQPTSPSSGYDRASELVRSVLLRQPFVRALAFGPTLVTDESAWRDLATLIEDKGDTELRALVCERAKRYLTAIGQPNVAKEVDESLVLIDLPDVQGIVATAPVFVMDDQLGVHRYGEGHEARRLTEAYEFQNTLGFVYCPSELAPAVHLAFRDIVFEQARVTLAPESWSLAKQSGEELTNLSAALSERGEMTRPLVAPPVVAQVTRLLNVEASKRDLIRRYMDDIEMLEYRFRSYKSSTNRVATRTEITDWMLQFEYYDIPVVVQTLRAISFWDRTALSAALRYGVQMLFNDRTDRVQVYGLGGATTSAQHLSYLWDDIRRDCGREISVLNSIGDVTTDAPLLLCDDNVGSGGQSSTVLMQWLGVARERWLVTEQHGDPLDRQVVDRLRACRLSICFLTGRRAGLETLLTIAEEHLGARPHGMVVVPTDIPCFDDAARVYGTKEDADRAVAAFGRAGQLALQDRIPEKPTEWVEQNKLGYGGACGLTVFHYNTPTTALTALWKDCAIPGRRWVALFPRRARLR